MPHIHFAYSPVYEEVLEGRQLSARERVRRFRDARAYIARLEKLWRPVERKVFSLLSDLAGVAWVEDHIVCYVVHSAVPFADPLTLPIYKREPDYFIDTLIHELIHRLIGAWHEPHLKNAWDWVFRRWHKEHLAVQLHIPLQAIHALVYLKLFGEDRLRRDIRLLQHVRDYKRSWDIVLAEGPELLVAEWKRRVRG